MEEFYKKDKYERLVKITGGISDAYNLFKQWKPQFPMSKKKYVDTCYLINKKLSDSIIRESLELKLPYRLGYIRIKSRKQTIKFVDGKIDYSKNAIDWRSTISLWSELYPGKSKGELREIKDKPLIIHENDHTNGNILGWYWDKRMSNVSNITAYKFIPVKGQQDQSYYDQVDAYYYGKKGLAKWAKSDDRDNEYYT